MAISDTIQSMYENVGEVYDTITNVSLPEHKNIENIPSTIRESYLEIMNNGIDVIWDNWEKVVGEGTSLTLNNTVEAPMKLDLKGNTYQDSTTGKNLFSGWEKGKGISSTNGAIFVNANGAISDYISVNFTTNTNYYVSGFTSTLSSFVGAYNSNKEFLGRTAGSARTSIGLNSRSFTSGTPQGTGDIAYIMIYQYKQTSDSGTIDDIDNMQTQIEVGSSATSYEPYTNGASPNPDYPQEIHVVSGDNKVKVEGKNKLNIPDSTYTNRGITNTTTNGILVSTGTASANGSIDIGMLDEEYTIQDGDYLYLFNNSIPNGTAQIFTENSSRGQIFAKTINTTNFKVNLSSYAGQKIKYVKLYVISGTIMNITSKLMIANNSSETTYEPYSKDTYPINLPEGMFLGSIGDYKDRLFKTSGKNLFDIEQFLKDSEATYTKNGEGSYTTQNYSKLYSTPYVFSDTDIPVSLSGIIDNGTATNIRVQLLDSSNNVVGEITSSSSSLVNKSACKLRINWSTGGTFTLKNIMLNEGTTALPYEPYSTGWYLEKKIGKVVLNGTEQAWFDEGGGAPYTINSIDFKYANSNSDTPLLLCNYFTPISYNTPWSNYEYLITTNQIGASTKKIKFRDTSVANLTDFKTWLTTHNTEVYYVLATPTYTKITDTTLLEQLEAIKRSYESQTNITQTNDDLPFVLSVSALKEI